MDIELHEHPDLAALRADWSALFDADPEATPFLAPGFGEPWLRHWAGGAPRPWILAVRDGGELVGLAALVLRRRGPLRTLLPLGYYVANYWDVLARPEHRGPVHAAVAGELARRRGAWDVISLDTLPAASPLRAELARAGLSARPRGSRPYPGFELPPSFDEYLATLPRNHRSNLRRHLRRLDQGEVEIAEVREPAALDGLAAYFQDVRERWWRARGKDLNPDHSRPAFGSFLAAMLRELVRTDRAVAWELRRDGKVLGVSVNLQDERRFYWWLSGFEPETAPLGPGKIVIGETIRRSIAARRRYYDFMVGGEPYKYWFGGADRLLPRLLVGSLSLRSAAVTAAVLGKDRLGAA